MAMPARPVREKPRRGDEDERREEEQVRVAERANVRRTVIEQWMVVMNARTGEPAGAFDRIHHVLLIDRGPPRPRPKRTVVASPTGGRSPSCVRRPAIATHDYVASVVSDICYCGRGYRKTTGLRM